MRTVLGFLTFARSSHRAQAISLFLLSSFLPRTGRHKYLLSVFVFIEALVRIWQVHMSAQETSRGHQGPLEVEV